MVYTHAKCFSALPLPRVTLPVWVPHNKNWKFSPLSWPKGKKHCNNSGGRPMTLPDCESKCDSAYPHLCTASPWDAGNQERSAPEKGLQDYRSPKQGDGDVCLHFFLSCSPLVSQSCKTQWLWPQSSEVQRHGLTEVAQVLQGKSMIRLLWFQVRIPPSGFPLLSQE